MNPKIKHALYILTAWIPTKFITNTTYALLKLRGECTNTPKKELTELMKFDNRLYGLQGTVAIRYGEGIHTKHKHMNYHQFFINHIENNKRVLEIGCGYGPLANAIATAKNVDYVGIDISKKNIEKAQSRFKRNNLTFIHGDALKADFDEKFDIVVMSNVLEHINDRVKLLQMIKSTINPSKIIIRIPLYERDWRVPLKEELGVEHRLDLTHYTEYTLESYKQEMAEAGMEIEHLEVRWGEIWSVVSQNPQK